MSTSEHVKNIMRSRAEKAEAESDYKNSSKERFKKIATQKMRTIMIGSLDAIEKGLGFLWGHDENKVLSEEEEELKKIFEQVRHDILNLGNNQIRNVEKELEQYDVTWNRYHITMPVVD